MSDGPLRLCAGFGCGDRLEGRQRNTRICDTYCRSRSERELEEVGYSAERAGAFWSGLEAIGRRHMAAKRRARQRRLAV